MAAISSDVYYALAPQPASAVDLVAPMLGIFALPLSVAQHIFALLPVDTRARAALVCRAWRDALADPCRWTRLDLSLTSGVTCALDDETFRVIAARARGQLDTVLLNQRDENVSDRVLLEVVVKNAGTLRELDCVCGSAYSFRVLHVNTVEQVARAAPQLRVLRADVFASVVDVHRLQNEVPFGALRLRNLEMSAHGRGQQFSDAYVLALAAAVPLHASLRQLTLTTVLLRTPAVLDAVVAAALAGGLQSLELVGCGLLPASVPALARIVRGGKLTSLMVTNHNEPLFDAAGAMQLADAIASSRTLQRLRLWAVRLWHDPAVFAALLHAVTGHPTLQALELHFDAPPDEKAAGAALAAVVAANSPALRELNVRNTPLRNEGMRPLLEALVENTHLQKLECCRVYMEDEFARNIFLPAVRANTSLRALRAFFYLREEVETDNEDDVLQRPALREAEELVAARARRAR